MLNSISKIDPKLLAEILGGDQITPGASNSIGSSSPVGNLDKASSSPFDNILSKAVDALEGTSKIENDANAMIEKYTQGKAELSDVMMATAKMNIAIQLAVTTVSSAVNTFKEITQMQI